METINTARLRCEPISPQHADAMYVLLQDDAIYQFLPGGPPLTIESLYNRYAFLSKGLSPDGRQHWLNWIIYSRTLELPLGYFQATIHEPESCEIAYMFGSQHWGQGYAREVGSALIPYMFETYNIPWIEAYIDTRNKRSIGLIKSLGFQRVRTIKNADEFKGSSSDEFVYSVFRNHWFNAAEMTNV